MAASPNGRWVVVANAGSDTLSVIDTRTDQVVETICARQNPADLFGAQPNALAFDKSGGRLFVCNGTQNAVAVFDFKPGQSSLRGLIPVGWFPGGIAYDPGRKALCVANIKGIGSTKHLKPGEPVKYNSHQYFGTLSLVPVPDERELSRLTQTALLNLRYGLLQEAKLPPRPGQPPRPVPERVGEPSVFKHVVYIIQENRTYDQVLGDLPQGNGDPSLCVFGEHITPNHHKLAREFVLLDNTYCSGILQRRRPPMGRQRHGHRLHGEVVRRFSPQLSLRRDRRRRGRAGLFARRFHLGQRHRARQDAARLRRIRHHRGALAGQIKDARARVPRLLPRLRQPDRRDRDRLPPRPSNRCGPTSPPTPWAGLCRFPMCSARRSSSRS